jgi:hypothetical protein
MLKPTYAKTHILKTIRAGVMLKSKPIPYRSVIASEAKHRVYRGEANLFVCNSRYPTRSPRFARDDVVVTATVKTGVGFAFASRRDVSLGSAISPHKKFASRKGCDPYAYATKGRIRWLRRDKHGQDAKKTLGERVSTKRGAVSKAVIASAQPTPSLRA